MPPVPERQDPPAGPEEDHGGGRRGARRPAQRLVERPRAGEVGDAEGDEADALLHAPIVPPAPGCRRTARRAAPRRRRAPPTRASAGPGGALAPRPPARRRRAPRRTG